MKPSIIAFAAVVVLSSCSSGSVEIEPIPGSITYGRHVARLTKSPAGSVLPHEFTDNLGRWVRETYIVQPDGTLKLVRRQIGEKPEAMGGSGMGGRP
ncbi:hypothetical protein HGP14_07755 [Rhizobium sp. P32RR-XVIII]|uniref:hypothetical protein n=1 Tax=Rhizobium sp. P32RR-XVIII TaxID=2726738 RepID=UPI0014568916|nr:hypothetical protein [Rhizobium sp. P32RR-XVIII]NLS03265.1 hypothetical protein [Rhizobium sp. P32RR-XVIII]